MPSPTSTLLTLNFITPINKIFPSPLASAVVFLVLNCEGDLSLYRKNEHVWSAGRFKSLIDVQWSPDGKFIAVQCEKKTFLYCAEDGKRISAVDSNESSRCRWFSLSDTFLLAVIDYKSHYIKWSVNCEFELKGGRMVLRGDEGILDVRIDEGNNELLVLQSNSTLTRLSFPFAAPAFEDSEQTISVLVMSKLSKHLQTVSRVSEELKNQFVKLLKLDDSVFMRISEIDTSAMRHLLLFGGIVPNNNTGNNNDDAALSSSFTLSQLNESEVLEWKSKLKKQHAELLVSVEEVSSVLRSFHSNYQRFCPAEVDKFLQILLPTLEDRSRSLQHNLAEYLVWLETLIIADANNLTGQKTIKAFAPELLALELAKSLNRSEEYTTQRSVEWLECFEDLKISLDSEFKTLINKINSVDLAPIHEINGLPRDFNRILSVDPLILMNDTQLFFKCNGKIIDLPDSFDFIKQNTVWDLIINQEVTEIHSSPSSVSFTPENDSTKLIIRYPTRGEVEEGGCLDF